MGFQGDKRKEVMFEAKNLNKTAFSRCVKSFLHTILCSGDKSMICLLPHAFVCLLGTAWH